MCRPPEPHRPHQIVDGESVLAAKITVAAAECQAGNACCRDDAKRDSETEGMGRVVNIAGRATGAHPHGPFRRIDAHAPHHRQINDQPIINAAESGSVMAAAADGDGQPVVTAKIYGGNHIRHIGAACDQQRPFVDRGVVELAS